MQEELGYIGKEPIQTIRYIEADKATYFYEDNTLVARDVTIYRYITSGHTLITSFDSLKPIMIGKASEVEFSLNGDDLNFKAKQMKVVWQ
jgi:hypothetical protein